MCSPMRGARPAGVVLVSEKRIGLPMWRSGPISGCSTVTMAPRAARCGSARWSSPFWTTLAETPACWSRSAMSSAACARVHAATRSSSCAARGETRGRRGEGGSSDQPTVVRNACQSRSSDDGDRHPAVVPSRGIHAVRRRVRRRVARLCDGRAGAGGVQVDVAEEVAPPPRPATSRSSGLRPSAGGARGRRGSHPPRASPPCDRGGSATQPPGYGASGWFQSHVTPANAELSGPKADTSPSGPPRPNACDV